MFKLQPLSQITFLRYENLNNAADFFEGILGLEKVLDAKWVRVWKTGEKSFIGAVESKGTYCAESVLISLTVNNIEEVYAEISGTKIQELTPIKKVGELPMKSFSLETKKDILLRFSSLNLKNGNNYSGKKNFWFNDLGLSDKSVIDVLGLIAVRNDRFGINCRVRERE